MNNLGEIAAVFFLSSVKFFFAPSSAVALGFNFIETIAITSLGGSLGVFFFYFLERWIFHVATIVWRKKNPVKKKKKKRVFTRRNRMIVRIKQKYGLLGVSIITPVLISIPIGTLIAAKYFKNKYQTLSYLIASVCVWSVVLTSISYFFKNSIN